MNSNAFQTILLYIGVLVAALTSALVSIGCTEVAGTISCAASSAPTWLIPYLGYLIIAIGVLKGIIGIASGKLNFMPTVSVVPPSQAGPGVVTQAQVDQPK